MRYKTLQSFIDSKKPLMVSLYKIYKDGFEDGVCVGKQFDKETRISFAVVARANGWTLEEIGKQLDITRERVRQILAKELEKKQKYDSKC